MQKRYLTAILVFVLTASFYIFTLSPSLAWGDGVKLQTEAITGESFVLSEMPPQEFRPDPFIFSKVGVAAWDHALYIMLGYALVKTFPLANPLWMVNLISAIFGAAGVTMVFLIAQRITAPALASYYAAFALAVSHTYWWHSSTPEVYTLFIFLLLVSYSLLDEFERSGKTSSLISGAFFLGLSASDHILAFLAIPAFVLYIFFSKKYRRPNEARWKILFVAIPAFLAGFSIYIIQFIRVSESFSISKTIGPALGSTFLSRLDIFSITGLVKSLVMYLAFLAIQFGLPGLILGALGIRTIFSSADPSLRKVISFFIVFATFGIFYRVTDQFAFFLTSYIFFAILMAIGTGQLLTTLRDKPRFALTLILFLTVLLTPPFYHFIPRLAARNGVDDSILDIPQIGTGVRNGLDYYIDPYKRGDFNAYLFGSQTMKNLAPNSVVIAEWYADTDEYFIFRYFNNVETLRPDVSIYGWPTEEPFAFDSQLVINIINESFPTHPIYLASLSQKYYAASKLISDYCIIPESNLYRLYEKGSVDSHCLGPDSVSP